MKSGIIIVSELRGPVADRVLEIQRRFDPRMAAAVHPHVTITGSSGMGPIDARTTAAELRAALEPIARETAPMTLEFRSPIKFMQKEVVVLPLNPNGPIRRLHERIKTSGLRFQAERFTFTPHATLNFFRELPPDELQALLATRVTEPFTIDHIAAFKTVSIVDSKEMLRLPLEGK